ncbi:hypothetical protein BSQ38_10595 [Pediococcus damnosus]|uniref:hypothetical protein n=1 Tax=Pediococcus damnosus TaxID=51663 RepID=UPI000C1C99FA|nr:hypothetical protein [Pediococcus damnosus]PIO80062.1 hypothetical protein BSQ38_10595 [Pediococcus damnosus]
MLFQFVRMPVSEEGFDSVNVETYEDLNQVDQMFGDKKYIIVMYRGYDSNKIIKILQERNVKYIICLPDKQRI